MLHTPISTYRGGSGATIWSTTINTVPTQANADGIDIDSIQDVTLAYDSITAGDDGVAVKTNEAAAKNITVRNSNLFGTMVFPSARKLSTASPMSFSKIITCTARPAEATASTDANAINIKTDPDCGGLVQQVTYTNTCIRYAKHLIIVNAEYGSLQRHLRHATIQKTSSSMVRFLKTPFRGAYETIAGYNSSNLAQVYVANIKLDTNEQSGDEYATIYLDNVNGFAPSGTDVTTQSFTLSGSVPSCSFQF